MACQDEDIAYLHCPASVNDTLLAKMACAYSDQHKRVASGICIIGVPCNLAIIIVLLRANMRNSCVNVILTAIALCDMTLMAGNFIYLRVDTKCSPTAVTFGWMLYTLVYANVSVLSHALSLWLTVGMAIIRYCILKSQVHTRSGLDSPRTALLGILVCVVFVTAGFSINIVRNKIRPLPGPPMLVPGDWCPDFPEEQRRIVQVYVWDQPKWYTCFMDRTNYWMTGVLFKMLPCVLLTIFMGLLLLQLYEARQRTLRLKGGRDYHFQGDRTTVMLIAIVAVFLVTELPQGTLSLAAGMSRSAEWVYAALGDILDVLALINSTVNFIMYCTMSGQFRQEFYKTFGEPCCQIWTALRPRQALPRTTDEIIPLENGAVLRARVYTV